MSNAEQTRVTAIVLDFLPHGRQSATRARYEQEPLVHALGVQDFRLYEIVLVPDDDAPSIGDHVTLRPPTPPVDEFREIGYGDLSSGAQAELAYAVEDLIDADEQRFVSFFSEAQPITLRLHQLDLLPGIGDKLRDEIIDTRRRGPFTDFTDLEDRIDGLHDPRSILVDRILEEIENEDVKYQLFAAGGPY